MFPIMQAPRLEDEVYQVVDQKIRNADMAIEGIQKGVLGAMLAFTPLLHLTFTRAKQRVGKDKELDDLGCNILGGLLLLVHVHNALSSRRYELVKPQLAPTPANTMFKAGDPSALWLYGGNLEENTKQCYGARKI